MTIENTSCNTKYINAKKVCVFLVKSIPAY